MDLLGHLETNYELYAGEIKYRSNNVKFSSGICFGQSGRPKYYIGILSIVQRRPPGPVHVNVRRLSLYAMISSQIFFSSGPPTHLISSYY